MRQLKIALGGPPKSGKSCLRERLKKALAGRGGAYPYFLTANPDGEGAWFQEASAYNPEYAQRLKRINKQKWSRAHAAVYAEWVKNSTAPLTLVDLGGIVDDLNEMICEHATHAILIAGQAEALGEWVAFCGRMKLEILAVLESDYYGEKDRVAGVGADGVLRGSIHHLERGELGGDRPMVEALAGHVLGRLEGGGRHESGRFP